MGSSVGKTRSSASTLPKLEPQSSRKPDDQEDTQGGTDPNSKHGETQPSQTGARKRPSTDNEETTRKTGEEGGSKPRGRGGRGRGGGRGIRTSEDSGGGEGGGVRRGIPGIGRRGRGRGGVGGRGTRTNGDSAGGEGVGGGTAEEGPANGGLDRFTKYKHGVTATMRLQQRGGTHKKDQAGMARPRTSRSKLREHALPAGKEDGGHSVIFSILGGDVTIDCPSSDKTVRIFLSSTFTDTSHERNSLMERIYPRLKAWCQQRGHTFQVVDMRWGVRDQATDDHRTTDLCLREIDLCKKLSTGPCFVTLLSQKYGYRPFPKEFPVEEFHTLLKTVPTGEHKDLISKWFKRDDNAVPSTYILQPISSHLPDFLSNDNAQRSEASNQWWKEFQAMQDAIGRAAVTCFTKQRAHAITQSVTEAEIRQGLLQDESLRHRSLWFCRQIVNLDQQPAGKLCGKFKDCKGSAEQQRESRDLLDALKTELTSALPPGHQHQYQVAWNKDSGMNPDKESKHKTYLNQLCIDFEQKLKQMIEEAIASRDQDQRVTPLVEEVTQHIRFCQEKCRNFYGRQDALKIVSDYLASDSQQQAFVIHGQSGCGKTSIVAMAATQACKMHKGKGVVILRFLGTSPDSTTVGSLLSSILRQLMAVKFKSTVQEDLPTSVKELGRLLSSTLEEMSSSDFPVTLLLDSLDQLHPANAARQLAWLPNPLPHSVKVIVSTLPEPQYEAFPKLQAMYSDTSTFYEVPTLKDNDVSGILDQWLAGSGRQLTANQRAAVLAAFKACPLPLFLKLSFDTACKWRSHFLPEQTVLQSTVRASINVLFQDLEKMHGHTLVSRALGYLTISQSGLTDTELEDILSCDDDVLNDVYTYWTPPVRRLPPLLLVRLKADLGQYLVARGADGVGVFFWYHRQFIEAAQARYCSDLAITTSLHTALADFFCGRWAGNAKPYKDKSGKASKADRIISPQPLTFGDSYNLRKLNNLPYHAIEAQNMELLKRECLLNFRFLLSKLLATEIRTVLDDFRAARKAFPDDVAVRTVAEALQLAQDALQYDPHQLPAQLLSRITQPPKDVEHFLKQCRQSDHAFLLANKQLLVPPGGQLVHSLSAHTDDVYGLAMTTDGKFVVTCSYDRSAAIIDVEEGRIVRKIEGIGSDAEQVYLCCNNTIIVISTDDNVIGIQFDTGVIQWRLEDLTSTSLLAFCGPARSVMVAFDGGDVILYDAKKGAELERMEAVDSARGKPVECEYSVKAVGNDKYVVAVNDKQNQIVLYDYQKKHLRLSSRILPNKEFCNNDDEDGDIDIEGLALTSDGEHILFANASDNCLHFMHVESLKVVRILKGLKADYSEKFHMTPDDLYVFFPNRRAVRVWDIHNNQLASTLLHVNMVHDVATVDMHTVVTIADDRLVRIWDLGRGLPAGKTTSLEFKQVPVWTPEAAGSEARTAIQKTEPSVAEKADKELQDEKQEAEEEDEQADDRTQMKIKGDMVMLCTPRYVLVRGHQKADNLYFLHVFDTAKAAYVRKASLGQMNVQCLRHVQGVRVLCSVNMRMKLVDVDRMKVLTSFQGRLCKHPEKVTHLVSGGKEVVTLTRDGRHLKIYNVSTGRVLQVVKQNTPKMHRIDTVVVNEEGTVAVAETEESQYLLLFDLVTRQHVHTFHPTPQVEDETTVCSLDGSALTPDGHYLLATGYVNFTRQGSGKGEEEEEEKVSENLVVVYDLHKREYHGHLLDAERFWQYKKEADCKVDTCCNALLILSQDTVLTAHDDFCLRVFNFLTGELLKRLDGHLCSPDLHSPRTSPLLLTHGTYSEENSFRLWTRDAGTHLASFTMDDELDGFLLLGDHGNHFLSTCSKYPEPVLFTVHGDLPFKSQPLTSYPELFKGKKLSMTIVDLEKDEGIDDENDPDDTELVNDAVDTDSDEQSDSLSDWSDDDELDPNDKEKIKHG